MLQKTNHLPNQQAVILDFLPYACFLKEKETETEPPGLLIFLALVRGQMPECGSAQVLSNLDQIASIVPLPCDFESSFVPTLSALGT